MSVEQCLCEECLMNEQEVPMPSNYRTRYIHFRQTGDDGEASPFGGYTVGWRQLNDELAVLTIARVLPHDRYVKRIGRDVVDQNFRANHSVFTISKEKVIQTLGLNLILSNAVLQEFGLDELSLKGLSLAMRKIAIETIFKNYL